MREYIETALERARYGIADDGRALLWGGPGVTGSPPLGESRIEELERLEIGGRAFTNFVDGTGKATS